MIFVLILALSFIPALTYAYIVYWLDRFEQEPLRLLGGVFLWGALVATAGAMIWGLAFEASLQALTGSAELADVGGTVIGAPIIEESLKGIAVLIVFLAFRQEFDSTLDGIVYAAITALGFAATENVLYLSGEYDTNGMGGMLGLFVVRVILGGWGHAVYTSFTGIGLAITRQSRNPVVKFSAPILGWMVGVALHALHNGMAVMVAQDVGGFVALLLTDWLGWIFAFAIVIWQLFRERRWVRTLLSEEVEKGIITRDQLAKAGSLRARIGMWFRFRGRNHPTRRFYQLCAELAQKKRQLAQLGDEGGNTIIIAELRGELARLAPLV